MNLLNQKEDIINQVKINGIYKIDKLLSDDDLGKLQNMLNKYTLNKHNIESYFYRSRGKFLFKKFFRLEFMKLIDCIKIINLSKKLKLHKIANNIFGKKTKLTSIDSYFSKKSNENIINWHVDQAYTGKINVKNYVNPDHAAIKFFIYLTDVEPRNGSLGYVPKTSNILYHLKKCIYNNELDYRPYWSLKDLRNILQDTSYRKQLEKKIDKLEIENFLTTTDFIDKDPFDTDKFDYKINRGGALIFNEAGVHRGSKPSKSNRLVIRFAYKILDAPD
tara:strand:- start:1222 stop:2049 length:828 start_codon:yes stop_codon:yes gene_type:complete